MVSNEQSEIVMVNTTWKRSPAPLACFQGGTPLCYLRGFGELQVEELRKLEDWRMKDEGISLG